MTGGLTVGEWLSRAAQRWADRPGLAGVDDERSLSHGELRELVVAQAERLRAWGIGHDDVVLLALPDGPMALSAFLTIASVATVLPVPAQEQPQEYARIFDEVPVRAILMDERPQAPLTRLATERDLTLLQATARPDGPAGTFLLSVIRPGSPRLVRPPAADDDALYCLTSGTSATPKIVAITHDSLWRSMESSRTWFQLSEHDRSLCLMPIAHLHSIIRSSLPVLAAGGSVVWTPGFDDARVPDWLDRFAPTFISAAPAVHRKLIGACDAAGWQARPGLPRLFAASSDKIDPATVRQLETRFGARVVQLYGMSETSPLIAATPLDGPVAPEESTGRVNPEWTVACLDADGTVLGPGEVGEIGVSGGIINRLVGRSAADAQRFDGHGRFLTGDLGRVDEHGFLFIEGRVDEVINRGGQKVHPAVVEDAISSHPAVRAASVFATPDPVLGSRVAAAVELHDGFDLTTDDLLEHAGELLRSYMVPERVFLTEAIPKNRLGKVSRRDLATYFDASPAAPDEPIAPPPEVLATVLEIYRHVLRRHDVDPDASFFDLGGDSLHTLYVLLELEERIGVSVPPATFARVSSASRLAAHVAQQEGRESPAHIVELQAGDRGPHLVVTHGVEGPYNYLAAALAGSGSIPGVPILALNSASRELLDTEPGSLEDLARMYATLVRESVAGPYALMGHSLGAHIAFATGVNLMSQGTSVGSLTLIDDDAELVRRDVGIDSRPLTDRSIAGYFRHTVSRGPASLFPGRIAFFRNEEDDADYRSDPTGGWGELALGGVTVSVVPGNHYSIVSVGRIEVLARLLDVALEAGRESQPVRLPEPDAQHLLRREARLACIRGHLAGEVGIYREVIAMDREQPSWVYENLASALFDVGEGDAARAALDEALGRDPWPLSIALRFAERWLSNGSGSYLERAVINAGRLEGDHPSVHYQRGQLALLAGLVEFAEVDFRLGLAMAPEHLRLHVGLAEALRQEGRFSEAAKVIAEANEHTPGLDWFIIRQAETLVDAGEPLPALDLLDRTPGIEHSHRGHLVRGLVLEALDRNDEALASFLRAADVQPEEKMPAQHLSLVLERLGRHDEALVWSDRFSASD